MKGTLTNDSGTSEATPEAIQQAVAQGGFFWLDLDVKDPGPDDDVKNLLINTFHFHPLAVEEAEQFAQRARIDDYDDYAHIVTFGVADDGKEIVGVHCFVTPKQIVSLHSGGCPGLESVRTRIAGHHSTEAAAPQVAILYLILDGLVDSFFPVLAAFDDSIDTLEDEILSNPTEQQLGVIFDMKRQIMGIRKAVTPQRDMLASVTAGMVSIPGMTDAGSAYFRNLYDHLIRLSDMVDSYRDLLSGAMDTHLSMVSNRLNVVMKQLAVIATIFLPLGYLTGFFGQNFSYLTNHLQSSLPEFIFLGLGLEVVAIVILFMLFKRRGWLGSGPTA